MKLFDAISQRVSVREYQPKEVSRQMLESLVDAGRRAPTARAIEPWEFVVITQSDMLQKLSQIASNGHFLKSSAACIAVFCKDTKYYLEDGCAATENILLAATGLGLGACWIAGDKKPYAVEVGGLLKVPVDLKLVSLISVGWPGKVFAQNKRRGLNEVIHWENF